MLNLPGRILLVLFLLVNGLVLTNAVLHEPTIQYDSSQHLLYIETLAQFRLPEFSDTEEYFSPPLPYVIPALLLSTGRFTLWQAAKVAQLFNVLLSIGLTLILLRICERVRPGNWGLKIATLCCLGVQTVYYKMFAFPRGEPWVAFLSVLSVYLALEMWKKGRPTIGQVIGLGSSLGLLALARQWGFFVFPAIIGAVILASRERKAWPELFQPLAASLAVATLIGAPFYLSLLARYGTLTAFNRQPADGFSFTNQPADFYIGLGEGRLFTSPVRPAFTNQFWPIFYSEAWGDYWQYFSIYGLDARKDRELDSPFVSGHPLEAAWFEQHPWLTTNRDTMAGYLGRVNSAGLFPSALYLLGLLGGLAAVVRLALSVKARIQARINSERSFARFRMTDVQEDGIRSVARDLALALAALIVIFSLVGYAWFLIHYPNLGKGDTIKAGYLLHIFPFLALLAGDFLERLRGRSTRLFTVGLALLALVFFHNLPAMVTHYIPADPTMGLALRLGINLETRTVSGEGWILLLSTLFFLVGLAIAYGIHSHYQLDIVIGGDRAHLPDNPAQLISVIVPARNEARNIRRCVEALLRQDYPRMEVIVVDDRSTDDTGRILGEIFRSAQNGRVGDQNDGAVVQETEQKGRLKVIRGHEPPAGWAGKPHAAWLGAGEARGEWLCFIDADTFAKPRLLSSAMAGAQTQGADLLTILTDQELGTFWERTILPLVFTALSFGFPASRVNDPSTPDAIANGQFILIRRSVYDAVGGHEAVQGEIAEDKALAELVKRNGYRLIVADGRSVASTRMYTSLTEIWEGWTKNIFLGMRGRLGLLLFGALAGLVGALFLPVWLLAAGFWFASDPGLLNGIVLFQAGVVWAYLLWQRGRASSSFGIPRLYAFTFPLGALLFTGMMFHSAFRVLSGRGVTWKGRTYV